MALCIWKKYKNRTVRTYSNHRVEDIDEQATREVRWEDDYGRENFLSSDYTYSSTNGFMRAGSSVGAQIGNWGWSFWTPYNGISTATYGKIYDSYQSTGWNYHQIKQTKRATLDYRDDVVQDYFGIVTAEQNTYPQNGTHTDGFIYVYQGLANKAPTISGTDTNLGTLTELEYKYSINDTDPSDTITVFERLDGTQLRTFTATRDIEYTIKPIWVEILNGIHTLTITATDNIGASTVRTITFAKAEHELEFTLQTPLPADDMVTKTIMSITREIPAGAVMQIYVCNNGFDEIPTWEDITAKVVDGDKFFFANTVKTAAEWGYNIKICVQRLGADIGDTIFITSVGGNYE